MTNFFTKRQKRNDRGFTLVELLVTIMIFVVLTSVVLFSQNSFNNSVLIKDLGYDIASTVRQAQNYAVDVAESQENTFTPYGVYFNINAGGGSNTNFVLFSDTGNGSGGPPDGIYDGTPSAGSVTYCPPTDTECVQKYTIGNGNYIASMCAGSGSGASCVNTNTLTILFKRPNPDAIINSGSASYADIKVSSASGVKKDVIITGVGQIYVQ